jgi:nucleoside-diphosphate-sugar epimerase
MRHFARDFAQTNRLRTEGTDHLLAAGRAAGVRRFVAQSYAAGIFARSGGPVKNEEDPLDSGPPDQVRTTIDAIRHLEDAVTGADWTEGVVLRYGYFYGPGTTISLGPEGTLVQAIRKRRLAARRSRSGRGTRAVARSSVAGPPLRRRIRHRDDDRGAGRVEREGQAAAGLGAAARELAGGLRDRAAVGRPGANAPSAYVLDRRSHRA